MNRCTLHVGAHKTGSSSIQDALFSILRDPAFQYAGGGIPNGSFLLNTLFDEPPDNQHLFKLIGQPGGSFSAFRQKIERQFQRAIRHAVDTNAELILSGEYAWVANREVLTRVQHYLNDCGFTVQVMGYVRPWTSWITSRWVQGLREGRREFVIACDNDRRILDVRGNVERLWEVFGRENVSILKFSPVDFPNGCVVRHFCGTLGLKVPEAFKISSNESLSLPAAQFLYSFNRFEGLTVEVSPQKPALYHILKERLQHLPGPLFRLHRTLLEPQLEFCRSRNPWIEQELGFSLADPGILSPEPNSIVDESDMFSFAPQALEWLANQTGQPVIRQRSGECAAREVARQVDLLRLRPRRFGELAERVVIRWRQDYARWRHRC